MMRTVCVNARTSIGVRRTVRRERGDLPRGHRGQGIWGGLGEIGRSLSSREDLARRRWLQA